MKWNSAENNISTDIQKSLHSIPKHFSDSTPRLGELIWIEGSYKAQMLPGQIVYFSSEPDEYIMLAAEKGSVRIKAGGIDGKILSGNAVVLSGKHNVLQAAALSPTDIDILSVSGCVADELLKAHMDNGEIYFSGGSAEVRSTLNVLEQYKYKPEKISSAAYNLVSCAYVRLENIKDETGYPILVETALGIMQREFAEIDGVNEIAERLSVTESHLVRLFTKAVGVSPGKILRKYRIEYAQTLLLQPEISITLAAELSGFSSGDYFSRVFRQETGITPGRFIKQNRDMQTSAETEELLEKLYL